MKLEAGAIVAGRYRLERCLGEGGMGIVWAATHNVTQRRHALKFVRANIHGRNDAYRRFLREARAASAVDHPNVVRVHDVFELEDGTPVMVMDFLEGETLGSLLKRRLELSVGEVAAIMVPVMSAVGTAHGAGVVHRDLKPDNIFLENQAGRTTVRVLDFGIAKLTAAAVEGENITETGALLGTPVYMSPEQSFGEKDIDHRTDIYALGVILFEALSGLRPVDGENLGQIIRNLMLGEVKTLAKERPDLPGDIVDLVGRMMSRERDGRPDDLTEVIAMLEKHTPVTAPRFGPPGSIGPASVDPELRSSPKVVIAGTGSYDGETVDASRPTAGSGQDTQGPTFVSISQRRPSRTRYAVVALGAIVSVGGIWLLNRQRSGETAVQGTADSKAGAGSASVESAPTRAPASTPSAESPAAVPSSAPEPAHAPAGNPSTESAPAVAKNPASAKTPRPKVVTATPAAPAPTLPANADTAKRGKGLIDEPPF